MCFYSQKFAATWTSWTIPLYKNLTICASLITISIIVTSVRFCGSVNCTNIPAWHFVLVFCLLLTCFVLFYLASTWKDKKPSRLMISCTILFIGKGNSHKDDFLGDFLFWEILFSRLSFLNFSSSDISSSFSYLIGHCGKSMVFCLERTMLYCMLMSTIWSRLFLLQMLNPTVG